MTLWILSIVALLSCTYSYGEQNCAQFGMCSGEERFGDTGCYNPGDIMKYPEACLTLRCQKIGNRYKAVFEKIECYYKGRCFRNNETWLQNRGDQCFLWTCTVTNKKYRFRPEPTSCQGK
uniref:Nacre protein n=1 Tax=Pinctada fucata TaxID=50426 RepID=A0A194ALQ9_PINFU